MNEGPTIPDPRDPAASCAAGSATPPGRENAEPTRNSTGPFAPAPATPEDGGGAAALVEGSYIGKYRVLEPLGGGGMGFVYLAENPDLKCPVAVKVIRAGELARPEERRRFTLECEALARFRHPHIVSVHDAGEHAGRPYLVMEYLVGGNLASNLARFQADARVAVALIEKEARAVGKLHEGGMLHRDLKPANVLLDDAGEPRVSDFGLVKLLESDEELTRTEQRPGTPPYMAPEQTEYAAAAVSPATDVWALGVMLYELLVGRRPFAAADRPGLFRRIATRDPDRPRSLHPDFDQQLEAVVLKCLDKQPARRFADAGALADELGRWRRGEPTRTRPEGRLHRLGRAARRRPWLTAALLLFGGTAMVLPVAFVVNDPDRPVLAAQRELSAGRPVTLIGAIGPPAWSRCTTKDASRADLDHEGLFTVNAWEPALVQLLPRVPIHSYRFRARIRHDKGEPQSLVGLFVGYHTWPTAHGHAHLTYQFAYNDFIDMRLLAANKGFPGVQLPDGNLAQFYPVVYADVGTGQLWTAPSTQIGTLTFAPAGLIGRRWRDLVIEARPGQLHGSFDGKPLTGLPLPEVERLFRNNLHDWPLKNPARLSFLNGLDPTFDPSGALGLVVSGTASFSNVVLEPLIP